MTINGLNALTGKDFLRKPAKFDVEAGGVTIVSV